MYLFDHDLEEMGESTDEKGEPQIVIRCAFGDFGTLQKVLEDRSITPLSAEQEYVCLTPTELQEEQAMEVLTLIDKLEQDEDVQKVFHTLCDKDCRLQVTDKRDEVDPKSSTAC